MSDLTDVKFFLASLIRPLINEAVTEALQRSQSGQIPSAVDDVLSIEQAANLLTLSTQTVYSLVSARKIPFSKPTGARLYFLRSELIEWLKSNRTATVGEQAQQFEQQRATRRKSATSKPSKVA